MPYQPPAGWVEEIAPLERHNVFHERAQCAAIEHADALVRVERPGRSRQCRQCVRSTAEAQLSGDERLGDAAA